MADLTRTLAQTQMPLRHERGGHAGASTSGRATAVMSEAGLSEHKGVSGQAASRVFGGFLPLCAGLLITLGVVTSPSAWARNTPMVASQGTEAVALSALPSQAQDVYQRIHAGGPFRYQKDGVVFGNRERLLPRQPRGFYREYTVPTPGERDRGARRIVCGGKEVRQPETCFYTRDHYASFQAIDPRH